MSTEELAFIRFPRASWSDEEVRAANEHRARLHSEMLALVTGAEHEDRNLTDEESDRFAELRAEFDALGA